MLSWLPYPLLRVAVAFLLGVVTGFRTDFNLQELEWLMVLLFGCYSWLLRIFSLGDGWRGAKISSDPFRARNPWLCLLGLLAIFVAGMLRTHWNPNSRDAEISSAEFYQAVVVEPTEYHPSNRRTTLEIQWVWYEGRVFRTNDRVQWYQSTKVPNGDPNNLVLDRQTINPLYHGDRLIIKGAPKPIAKPANPREFDYAGYLSRKNIFWRHWVAEEDIVKWSPNKTTRFSHLSYQLKSKLRSALENYLPSGAPQEVAGAMLLGEREAVSDTLEQSFARSGAIHILAVSGLHLGILYWLLLQVFSKWRTHPILKWLFIVICLMVLWSYTIITGLAPSTQRAASMFSLLLLGNTLSKQTNTINTLGGSAMFILWVDPYQIYAVGFQLSFIALLGILFIQPLIAGRWKVKNKLLKYLWELVTVSLAAQMAVFPLSVYYFNQLPVYFLLANLLLIPAAFAIIVIGMVFFLTSILPAAASLVAAPLTLITQIASQTVQIVANLPGSTLGNLTLDFFQVTMAYVLLWALLVFVKSRKKTPWLVFLGVLTLLCAKKLIAEIESRQREMIGVYHIPGHTAVDFIDGKNFRSVMDRELIEDRSTIEYKISNFRRYLEPDALLMQTEISQSPGFFDLWMFSGKRVLLIKSAPEIQGDRKMNLKSDIAIVSNNSVKDLKEITLWLKTGLLIIDGSNKPWTASKLENQALSAGFNVHNCWTEGAKIINLKTWL